MKNFFKIPVLLLVVTIVLQSCTSEESNENIISDELVITTNLADKIITVASSVNDYNFFVNNVINSNCDFLNITQGYFNTSEGDYYRFYFETTDGSLENWLSLYNDSKLIAYNATGVAFTDDDFILASLGSELNEPPLYTRDQYLEYFEDCIYADTIFFRENGLPYYDINLNCDNSAELRFSITTENNLNFSSLGLIDLSTDDLSSVEDLLTVFNTEYNTSYSLDNVELTSIYYIDSNNTGVALSETEDLLNYFENCMFSRDDTIDDCLNFIYPLQVNRFSLQLEEVITITIESDEDLITTFSEDVGELGFAFPINLLGADGTVVTVETNEELESALDSSAFYCY